MRGTDTPGGNARAKEDICWGRNPVTQLLLDEPSRCLKVIASKSMQRAALDQIAGLCRESGVPLQKV